MDRILPTPRMRIGINGYVPSLTNTLFIITYLCTSCICMIDQAKRRCRPRGYLGAVRTTSEFYHLTLSENADIVMYDIVAKVSVDLQASTSSPGTGLPPPISMVRFPPSFSPLPYSSSFTHPIPLFSTRRLGTPRQPKLELRQLPSPRQPRRMPHRPPPRSRREELYRYQRMEGGQEWPVADFVPEEYL